MKTTEQESVMGIRGKLLPILVAALVSLPGLAVADELTQIIQRDLVSLGYDPGNTDGEATMATVVAISRFQAEHGLEVTGEPSPQLAGVIKAAIRQGTQPAAPPATRQATAAATPSVPDATALRAAQQACLQQKAAEAQEAQQRRRGMARLARAVTRTASRLGGDDFSRDVADLSRDVYDANAIASDFKGAAEDLGLSESDIEACRNPG
jgi:peptidoglycan hydrolase-like protein with peptidoglycan-binding domain